MVSCQLCLIIASPLSCKFVILPNPLLWAGSPFASRRLGEGGHQSDLDELAGQGTSSLGKVDSHGRIGRHSAHAALVLTKLNLEERNRGVRSFSSDGNPTPRLASCPFPSPRTPLPIAQNPSVCVDRRAALQRRGSQRFPQG
jgi:hypothetical protein